MLVLYLYQAPLEASLYGLLLTGLIGVMDLTGDFFRFRKKRIFFEKIRENGTENMTSGMFPEPGDTLEEEYQNLLFQLLQDRKKHLSEEKKKEEEMEEYYTLWAHQIKTPIAAMSLLLQEKDTPEYAELSMELFSIEQYVEMVLQYLRLGSESTDFVLKEYDLDTCIRQAIRKYARSFIRKKITLDFSETKEKVLTDEKWLVFVLEQLLSNALKYTKSGTIRIYADKQDLVIEDTGIGIAPEDLPRIFEKGYTGYNGRKDKKSTGIGLYLCRKILDRLSHGIAVTSEPGKGTKVRLYLRREKMEFE